MMTAAISKRRGVFLFCALTMLVFTGVSYAQPEGWRYERFQYEQGRPGACLIGEASGEKRVLHPGDSLEGYRVLTINADRIILRNQEVTATLFKAVAGTQVQKNESKLDKQVRQLRAERRPLKEVLEQLCSTVELKLELLGELPGSVSVDFSDMTAREILDSLARLQAMDYKVDREKLIVEPHSNKSERRRI